MVRYFLHYGNVCSIIITGRYTAVKFRENDNAYIVENYMRVTKVRVMRTAGGLCTVTPKEGKALRLPEGRLY